MSDTFFQGGKYFGGLHPPVLGLPLRPVSYSTAEDVNTCELKESLLKMCCGITLLYK